MTIPKPTREQVEAYWYIEGTPKPTGYDEYYNLDYMDEEED